MSLFQRGGGDQAMTLWLVRWTIPGPVVPRLACRGYRSRYSVAGAPLQIFCAATTATWILSLRRWIYMLLYSVWTKGDLLISAFNSSSPSCLWKAGGRKNVSSVHQVECNYLNNDRPWCWCQRGLQVCISFVLWFVCLRKDGRMTVYWKLPIKKWFALICDVKSSNLVFCFCRPGQSASRELLFYLNGHFNKLIGNATDKLMTFSVSTLNNEHHGECPDREVMGGRDRSPGCVFAYLATLARECAKMESRSRFAAHFAHLIHLEWRETVDSWSILKSMHVLFREIKGGVPK